MFQGSMELMIQQALVGEYHVDLELLLGLVCSTNLPLHGINEKLPKYPQLDTPWKIQEREKGRVKNILRIKPYLPQAFHK